MRRTEHSPSLAWILVLAVAACRPGDGVVAQDVATARPARCVVRDRNVSLPSRLALLSAAPAAGAMAIDPFAELRHSDSVQMELPAGKPSAVRLEVETTMLRLHGFATASDAVFYPDSPSMFGGMVVPLATNTLEWRETTGDQVLLVPGRQAGARISIEPEWRDCSYLRLQPKLRFTLGFRKISRLDLERGAYLVRSSPEAPASKVSLELSGDEEIWILETRRNWARILWEAADVAIVGWINRNDGPSPALGHGSGTGQGVHTNTCVPGPVRCGADVTLFAERDGSSIEVGSIKQGTSITLGRVRGDYTEVEICDPDVTFLQPVTVRTQDARSLTSQREGFSGIGAAVPVPRSTR